MAGTKHQCTQLVLDKLILHWPGYYIVGSTPYKKGCRIHRFGNDEEVQFFDKNDNAFLTMTEAITKGTGWFPGKSNIGFFKPETVITPNSVSVFNNLRKAKDYRVEADRLMKACGIEPMDPLWLKKVDHILKIRRSA
jgi:hypothetical protein